MNEEQLHFWHIVCRKGAHITEYFILGALAWRAFRGSIAAAATPVAAVAFVLAVALSDEFHQLFVASRTGALADVGYDLAGGVLAVTLMQVFRREVRSIPSHPVL